MIKRSGAYVLTLLYLITVTGFALNLHYCCSHLYSVKINVPVKSCNVLAVAKMKCCQDKHFEVKVKDVHQAQSSSFLSKIFSVQFPKLPFSNLFLFIRRDMPEKSFDKDLPDPPSNNIITFLKNCTLRI